jgi:hypothetical protein
MKKVLFLFLIICLSNDLYSQNVIEETYIVKGKKISKEKYDSLWRKVTDDYYKYYLKKQKKRK